MNAKNAKLHRKASKQTLVCLRSWWKYFLAAGSLLFAVVTTPGAAAAGPMDNAVSNPGFETGGLDYWTEWHPAGQAASFGVDSNDPHFGSKKLYFYAGSKYEQSVHQTMSGLVNGTYIVSAWIKQQYAVPDTSRMELSQNGTPRIDVHISNTDGYRQITATVPVTTGKLDIGFYVASSGGTSLQIDDVRVEQAELPLLNASFTNDYADWSRTGDLAAAKIGIEGSGNKYADLYSAGAYKMDLFQNMNLTAGKYTLQAKVRRSGTFVNSVMYADFGGQTRTAATSASTDWTTIRLSGITVGSDGEAVKLGFWTDANPGSWVHIDDVTLIRNEPSQQFLGDYTSHVQSGNAVTFTLQNIPKVRVEFVKPEIARIWMEPGGTFAKDASFVVDNESFGTVSYTVSDQGDYIRLQSSGLTVRVNKSPFRISYYDAANINYIAGERVTGGLGHSTGADVFEYMAMDPGEHFYGLGIDRHAQSLDRRGKRVEMDNAMVSGFGGNTADTSGTFFASTKGYGIFFDNTYQHAAFDMGQESPDYYYFSAPNGEMVYYFINGPAIGDLYSRLADLSGKAPLPPKWALGYIQSRYGYDSWSEVHQVVDTFRAKGIPLDGMVLDVYWAANNHYFDFEWNTADGFADPAGNLLSLRNKGVKVTNIVDPYIQQTANNFSGGNANGYFAKSGGSTKIYQAWYGPAGLIDFTNPAAARWYTDDPNSTMDVKKLWDDGVRGWWIDLNEPETPTNPADAFSGGTADKIHNVYALNEAKAFYDAQRSYTNERVWNLARSGFTGIQQYGTTVWTADVDASWDSFTHNLQLGLSAGLSGMPYVSHDTGGFNGKPTPELYTRWMQSSAFMPVFRAHGAEGSDPTNIREPWAFGPEAEGIVKEAIKQRYRMLPYIYSAARETEQKGTPMMKALVLDYLNDPNVANLQDQWMFGPSLLVAPVHVPGAISRSVYLPDGIWHDWNSGNKFTGGQTIQYSAPLATIPVFVKEGSIVPVGKDKNYDGEVVDDFINLKVYPLASGVTTSYSMFEDDGKTYGYESGSSAATQVSVNKSGNSINLTIGAIQGSYPGMVTNRQWRSEVKVEGFTVNTVTRNGTVLRKVNSFDEFNTGTDVWFNDSSVGKVLIQTNSVPTSQAQAIVLNGN
ncbi:glycoside hydrolase family 31 protein [Paenibacillus sp. BR2-3]|uniref:TIM-barrel domain-containing protein n=1 Tax=Paenibacillus sp. BR2-3 TaxID=3048494 RepID=UPI0039773D61